MTNTNCGCLRSVRFWSPRDFEEFRRAIQAGQDALAVALRDLQAFREQFGLRREASAERAAAEILREEEVPKKANVSGVDSVRDGYRLTGAKT